MTYDAGKDPKEGRTVTEVEKNSSLSEQHPGKLQQKT
jgi:hypothetical protein